MKNFNFFKAFNVSLLAQISLQMYFLSMWFCTLSHTSTLDTFCWHLSKDSVICNMFALLKLQFFICFLLLCVSLVIHFINSCKGAFTFLYVFVFKEITPFWSTPSTFKDLHLLSKTTSDKFVFGSSKYDCNVKIWCNLATNQIISHLLEFLNLSAFCLIW